MNSSDFEVRGNQSRICNAEHAFKVNGGNITLSNVRFQVGDNLTENFSHFSDCETKELEDLDSTAVIVVGIVLGVLVAAVLIGFVYSRYRMGKKNYD